VAYTVRLSRAASREFSKLQPGAQQRIAPAIDALAGNPWPPGCRKLAGSELFRIREGDYRIIYSVDTDQQVLEVEILKIGNRADVYRFLKN
jgi:mRNA interferase RelE/StbE